MGLLNGLSSGGLLEVTSLSSSQIQTVMGFLLQGDSVCDCRQRGAWAHQQRYEWAIIQSICFITITAHGFKLPMNQPVSAQNRRAVASRLFTPYYKYFTSLVSARLLLHSASECPSLRKTLLSTSRR